MPAQLCFAPERLTIRPWTDDVPGPPGYDPRSTYAEEFWLGVLGPSTMWLLRRIAAGFDYCPAGFDLDLSDTARSLGIGDRSGRHSPLIRSLNRTVQFRMAKLTAPDELAVKTKMPPLNRQQLARLPRVVQERHALWQQSETGEVASEQTQRRACQLALSLADLGEDFGGIERQLLRWQYPASIARRATAWALEHHGRAFGGATATTQLADGAEAEARGA